MEGRRRGWVDVYETQYGTWSVYDWTEERGSGYEVGTFDDRIEAIRAALKWADENNRKMGAVADDE